MSKQDAELIKILPCATAEQAQALSRIVAQLESDAKRFEDSKKLQEIGKSAYDSIAEMVAALECDYDRLEELKEARANRKGGVAGSGEQIWDAQYALERAELTELEEAAGECTTRDDAEQRIMEDPLSVEVRSEWHTPGDANGVENTEFTILLGTGGPATRIIGELTNGEPHRAWIEAQDWFQPWTVYVGGDMDTVLTYCRCFYFGEG